MRKVLFILCFMLATQVGTSRAKMEQEIQVSLLGRNADWAMPGTISVTEICKLKTGTPILSVLMNGRSLWVKKMSVDLDIRSSRQSYEDAQTGNVINEALLKEMENMKPGDAIECSKIMYVSPEHKDISLTQKYRIRVSN